MIGALASSLRVPLSKQSRAAWFASRAVLYLGIAATAACLFLVWATVSTKLRPSIPAFESPAVITPPTVSTPDTLPASAPQPTDLIADIPPADFLMGALVFYHTGTGHVIAIGFDSTPKVVSVLFVDDASQTKLSAPVNAFVWSWDPKRSNVTSGRQLDSASINDWVKIEDRRPVFPARQDGK